MSSCTASSVTSVIISCSSDVSSARVAPKVRLVYEQCQILCSGCTCSGDSRDHVLGDSVDVLDRRQVAQRIEVQRTIALDKSRSDTSDLLTILNGRIVFGPDEVQHAFHARLQNSCQEESEIMFIRRALPLLIPACIRTRP